MAVSAGENSCPLLFGGGVGNLLGCAVEQQLCVLEEEPPSAHPDSPSVCLVLNWEEPCNNGSEILAYNIDLGDSCITVGNTTTHVMKNLLPETTYR